MTMSFNGNTSQQIIPIDAESYEALGGSGGSSKGDAEQYTLPQATENALGGIKASEKTAADTAEVKIDSETGKLFVNPSDVKFTELPDGNEYLGSIVQYVGETTEQYTQGYFYKCVGEPYVEFTPIGENCTTQLTVSLEDFKAYLETLCEGRPFTAEDIVEGQIGYHNITSIYSFSAETAEGKFFAISSAIADLEEAGFTFEPPLGPRQGIRFTCKLTDENWVQVDVQPETDISGKADVADLQQEVQDRQAADTKIINNVWSNSTMNGGHFQNKITNNDGSYALLFNESDGGGAQYFNKTKNSLQFVGVNDGNDGIYVQMYAKDKATNVGARLNVSTTGIYYTLRNNGQYTAEDEVAVKKDINDLNAEVQEALSQIDVKIESIFHYKGTVATTEDLPKTGNVVGDVYNIASDGHNVAFDGTGWDKLSETIDLTPYMTIAAFNTAIANYYTKAQVDDKDQAVKNDIYGRIWSNVNNPAAGHLYTKMTNNKGGYALIFNENDGGGSQIYDKTDDILSYVGTNLEEGHSDESNSINVQIYSKDKTTNEGVRINVNTDKAYYLKGSVKTNTANREIATLADIDNKFDNMLLLTYEVLEEVE